MDDSHERPPRETAEPDFARGQDEAGDLAEEEHRGDFAEGQAATHISVDTPRGDFAEGQEREPHDPELSHPNRGDFAEGQEHTHDRDADE